MPFFKKKKSKVPAADPSKQLPPDMVYSLEPRHGHAQDVFDENNVRQVAGCLPIDPIHKRFLLVTSSSNPGTWVIPKGGWEKDETQQQAAMRETWEEAGIKGIITRHIGVFAEKSKTGVKAHHWIYEMEIIEVTKKFPEQKKRERRWFTYDEAMLVVKASYIHDALSMSSLSPLVHPNCDSLQTNDSAKKKEKKKEKKKKQQEDEDALALEIDLEEQRRKKEKKKEKKREKKERKLKEAEEQVTSDEDEQGVPLTSEQKKERRLTRLEAAAASAEEDTDDEETEKKKKKKKKKGGKKGEISELTEEEIGPMFNSTPTPLNKLDVTPTDTKNQSVEEKYKPIVQQLPLTQQLRETHISSQFPQPHQFPIPQPQFSSSQQRPATQVPIPQRPAAQGPAPQQRPQQQFSPKGPVPQQRPHEQFSPNGQRPQQQFSSQVPQQRPAQQYSPQGPYQRSPQQFSQQGPPPQQRSPPQHFQGSYQGQASPQFMQRPPQFVQTGPPQGQGQPRSNHYVVDDKYQL